MGRNLVDTASRLPRSVVFLLTTCAVVFWVSLLLTQFWIALAALTIQAAVAIGAAATVVIRAYLRNTKGPL